MEISTTVATATALTIAVVQIVKAFNIDRRLLPVAALIIGVGATALVDQTFDATIILNGVISGLSAMGLWTGTKVVAGADEDRG